MARKPYSSDLTDEQWALIEDLIPPAKPDARPRKVSTREVVNAIIYLLRSGCAWRLLPHDFPKWNIVYHYFWRFRREGIWQAIHDLLRDELRVKEGREVSPSAAVIDSYQGWGGQHNAISRFLANPVHAEMAKSTNAATGRLVD